MRIVVAREGVKEGPNNRLIARGALVPGDRNVLPVVWGSDPIRIIGTASGFLRDEKTGEISFEVKFGAETPSFKRAHASVYITNPKVSTYDDQWVLQDGVIAQISINPESFCHDTGHVDYEAPKEE